MFCSMYSNQIFLVAPAPGLDQVAAHQPEVVPETAGDELCVERPVERVVLLERHAAVVFGSFCTVTQRTL